MIFGDKESIAIEIELSRRKEYLMGHARIWLNSCYIGFFEEEIMIQPFVATLRRILNKTEIGSSELILDDVEREYQSIKENDYLRDRCLPGFGESFDDFEIYVYRIGGALRFIWRLVDSPFFEYVGYPRGLKWADIQCEEMSYVLSLAEAVVHNRT